MGWLRDDRTRSQRRRSASTRLLGRAVLAWLTAPPCAVAAQASASSLPAVALDGEVAPSIEKPAAGREAAHRSRRAAPAVSRSETSGGSSSRREREAVLLIAGGVLAGSLLGLAIGALDEDVCELRHGLGRCHDVRAEWALLGAAAGLGAGGLTATIILVRAPEEEARRAGTGGALVTVSGKL